MEISGKTSPPGLGRWQFLLRIAGSGLLAVTGAIHLDLYLTGYRTIPTIGPLFLLQVIAAFILAAAVLAFRNALVATAGALFSLATLGGYLLSMWVGLFGFREVRTTAGVVAGVIEVAAFAALALAVFALVRTEPAGPLRLPATGWLREQAPRANWMVGGVSVLAVALLAGAVASSGSNTASGGHVLKTMTINGATVLTNTKGLTLYWFAADSPGKSKCYGSCAAYWPPVPGPAMAGSGVTGTLGTTHRTDGTTQATYNDRPLYTYIGDGAPGEAHGNNINLNGGIWHEALVSG